jgi:hypothetical protein
MSGKRGQQAGAARNFPGEIAEAGPPINAHDLLIAAHSLIEAHTGARARIMIIPPADSVRYPTDRVKFVLVFSNAT